MELEHLLVAQLRRLHMLLKPGGCLITITPNWHMRPSDVTDDFHLKRSEAIGFQLKEYTLCEVSSLLVEAGFASVATPAWISLQRIYCHQRLSFTRATMLFEPWLEQLPYRLAVQCCRWLGLSCTIATKSQISSTGAAVGSDSPAVPDEETRGSRLL